MSLTPPVPCRLDPSSLNCDRYHSSPLFPYSTAVEANIPSTSSISYVNSAEHQGSAMDTNAMYLYGQVLNSSMEQDSAPGNSHAESERRRGSNGSRDITDGDSYVTANDIPTHGHQSSGVLTYSYWLFLLNATPPPKLRLCLVD